MCVCVREFVLANVRHPESGRAVSLDRNGDEHLQSKDLGDPGDPGTMPSPKVSDLGGLGPKKVPDALLHLSKWGRD